MKTRKELIKEYKMKKPRLGVFQIRNISNGKIFVRGAFDLETIWSSQQFKLELGGHTNEALQKDWKEFGADKFEFLVLHELKSADDPSVDARAELKALEDLCLEELQPYGERGYNRPKRVAA